MNFIIMEHIGKRQCSKCQAIGKKVDKKKHYGLGKKVKAVKSMD